MFWVGVGALLGALGIAAGAFGAHGLSGRLDPQSLDLWETGARYLMYGAFGQIVAGLTSHALGRPAGLAGPTLLAGSLVFSSTLFAMALGAPRWLGAVTPIGGALLIFGLLLVAVSAWRPR
jgi:uncharacterized membrane protein YgdD (TMEM256/DUF423 family)